MSVTNQVVIEVAGVDYSYGQNTAVQDLYFKINKGDYVGIIGPNGGGKTTLVKLLLGLIKPTKGKITRTSQHLGYVPQRIAQSYDHFPISVEELVANSSKTKAEMDQVLKTCEVLDLKHKLLSELSGGQRQRVFIARALAGKPEILILDEPTIGVDLPAQDKFYSLLTKLNQDQQLTIIFVSHDVEVIAREVNTVLCLNKTLVCHGSPKDFIKPEFLAKLYGDKVKFILHKH